MCQDVETLLELIYIKIDDKLSNEEILSYTNPIVETNKLNKLSDSVNVLNNNDV